MVEPSLDELQSALGPAYTLERELGRGGMATVYLARDTKHGRPVALKVLHADLAAALGPERFRREIATAALLQHPHILGVYDSGEAATGQLWFTMPYIEGESLRDRLRRESQLPVDDVVRIVHELAGALDYAHDKGVVHRDIKPENILLTKRGDALLADFGIARSLGGAASEHQATGLTGTGLAVGTPQYMSPEQASADRTIDARSDVYALGAVCYEMLAGEPPFVGHTAQAVIAKMLSGEAPSVRLLRPGVPLAIDAALHRALERAPVDRWATTGAFASALTQGTLAVPSVARPASRVPAAAIAAGVAAFMAAGAFLAWRSRSSTTGDGGSAAVSAAASNTIRLAVLPFENLGDSADGYFADGVTDAVRGKLTGVPGLEVIGSSSSGQYRRSPKSPQQIGKELGVKYLLVGKVRWDKQQGRESEVQVSPELVDAVSAAERWSQPFDAPLTHVFQVQGDIAGQVAQALRVTLTPATQQTLAARPTADLAAYDAYLRGRELARGSNSPVVLRRAIVQFRDAVGRDSSFALAWAALADAYATLQYNTGITLPGVSDSVDRASARALSLAPALPEAHAARGSYYLDVKGDNPRGVAEAQAGLTHGPNARLLTLIGRAEEGLGKWESAAAHVTQATVIDPRDPAAFHRLAEIALRLRRPDEARAAADRALVFAPDQMDLIQVRVMASLQMADLAGARAVLAGGPASIDRDALGAYMAQYWDLGWVLDSTLSARVLALHPDIFGGDTATWAVALMQQAYFDGDRARTRSLAEAARVRMEPFMRSHPNETEARLFYALALGYLGRNEEAVREADHAVNASTDSANARDFPYQEHQRVRVYLLTGQTEKALDILERLMKIPYYLTPGWLKIDPSFAPLRGNPRFEKLVATPPPLA